MKRIAFVLFAVVLTACGKSERSSTIDLVKTVATESRTKPHVEMTIRMTAEQATPEDLATLKSIEDAIEQTRIGRILSSGTNAGYMNVVVEVDNTADGIEKLRKVVQSKELLSRSSFKVSSGDEH